jgi:hypothetical protein
MPFYDDPAATYDSGLFYDEVSPPNLKGRKMSRVKLNLDRLNPEELVASANTVKTAMTGNANFPTPNPTLAAFGTLITTATTKIAGYNTKKAEAETALADRDAALAELRGSFTLLGDYVQNASGGDAVKIESAGMDVRAAAAPVTMTQVLDLAVTEGDSAGTLDSMWSPVTGARSYEIQTTTADPLVEANWAFKKSSSKSRATLDGLTSGSKVWVRVRAVGTRGSVGAYSDPANKTVP